MSASVSRIFIHRPLFRAMSQAIGTPVIRSMVDTSAATVKEFSIATSASDSRAGLFRMYWIVFHFRNIPRIGGNSMSARNRIRAAKYTVYFKLFFEDSLYAAAPILRLILLILSVANSPS